MDFPQLTITETAFSTGSVYLRPLNFSTQAILGYPEHFIQAHLKHLYRHGRTFSVPNLTVFVVYKIARNPPVVYLIIVILRNRAEYHLILIADEAVGRVG